MMKKLFVLMLVLGLTSYVQAAPVLLPIELSVNGVYDGPGNNTDVPNIVPCTYIVIDVQAPQGLDWTGYVIINGAFPGANGEWGDMYQPVSPLNSGYYYADTAYPKVLAGAGDMSHAIRYEEGVPQGLPWWGFGYEVSDNQATGMNPGGTAFELMFHCAAPGDVTISLYNSQGDYITPDDRITVHQQIPEPMTVAMLGLGGLFLRRRKK